MKKKLVNRFLGLIMTGTLILTSAVSPMAAEITVFTEEGTQSEENSYSDFSVTDDEDDSSVTIEEEPEESEEEIAIESDDGTNEKSETDDIFSDSESEEVTEFADAETRTPEKALTALYDAFKNYKIGTALAFPYGTGEGQYTNAKAFIQAEIEKIVPKSEYDVQFNYTGTLSGASGKETTMDTASLDIAPVHAAADTKPGFTGVTFSIGDKVSSKINLLYLAVKPLEVTAQEAVTFEAEQISFDTIKGTNTSQDQIVTALAKLPTAAQVYKSGDNEITLTWNLTYVSGTENCMTLDAKGTTTTVVRPNVGKENAVYKLEAVLAYKKDPTVSKTLSYDLTVPAFEPVVLPIRITPADATFTLTDNYYKTSVDASYISTEEDGALRKYTLHAGASSATQTYAWTAEREGYITKSGKITVKSGEEQEQVVSLTASSEDDAKLERLYVSSATADAPSIKSPMTSFDKDTYAYEMTVGAIDSIIIKGNAIVPEATVKVTRHSSLKNANKGTTMDTSLSATGSVTCYLKSNADTEIKITVTAPTGSVQGDEIKTKVYKLTVHKNGEAAHSLKSLTLFASASDGSGMKVNTLSGTEYTTEETLSPAVDQGGVAEQYRYEVNYYRDQVTFKPALTTTTDKVQIKYQKDGEEQSIDVANNKVSANVPLTVGDNTIKIVVTKKDGSSSETYPILVHRKQKPEGNVQIDGSEEIFPFAVEETTAKDWTGRINFNHSLREVPLKVNVPDDVTVKVSGDEKEYKNRDIISVAVDESASKIITLFWIRNTKSGEDSTVTVQEAQKYVLNLMRAPADSADFLGSYLPAPGQFVNVDMYKDPSVTLAGPNSGRMVTLGSFGGSIVYEFEEPIQNSDQNPYGIDFIVYGNVQKSETGESYSSGMEPAAVMVSQDGNTWYELAGSDYYERTTQHNISMTYTNPDTTFKSAVDIPWTDSTGASGTVKANTYHSQAYYPDPLNYGETNKGTGENKTYTDGSMTVSGTRVSNSAALNFGYGDTHANAAGNDNTAVNPYRENPNYNTNGDGMDISWAVDADGNPLQLDSIKYVKIYTAQSKDNGSMGEVSSEISGVLRVKSGNASVGKTNDLKNIVIDGNEIELKAGVYTYNDVPVNDVSAFKVTPTAGENSNIYVSNQRVKSGATSKTVSVQKTLRVIVQDDQKEPAVYFFNLSGTADPAANTTLKTVSAMPGGIEAEENGEGYVLRMTKECKKIRLSAEALDEEATVKINGKAVTDKEDYLSDIIPLNDGDTEVVVEVTSRNGKVTKSYSVIIKREDAEDQKMVQVNFSLVGDEKHGKDAHTWRRFWLNQVKCSIPEGSTAKYVTEMMLLNNDIPFSIRNGNYVTEINGLKEFDNGPGSGWMYAVNGTSDNVNAIDLQILTSDCTVTWYYVDDYTKDGVPDLNNINADHVCRINDWKTTSKATVFAPEKQQGTCAVCGKTTTRDYGTKLAATIKLNAKSIKLQKKQTTKKIKVTMANGDSIKSWKSSNKKIVTVNKKGVIKAGKKNGTAKITVTLASGKKATLKVKVQSPRVNTTKIKGLKSKVSLKKGEKLTLKPAISPLTSQDKVTYTSSNKKVATVSKKGVITAKKKGTVKITVKSGKKSYTVKVKVK